MAFSLFVIQTAYPSGCICGNRGAQAELLGRGIDPLTGTEYEIAVETAI